ncbi:hypothetical protein [Edwardsiella tarda]|uniref:hypothetical protein n=1 Tax=Edwardsiella tarda TaxID=636 RepID=UPI00055862D7|nr:hypothetical protein [Edwardsiella tarda]
MLEKPEHQAAYAALKAAGGLATPRATHTASNVRKAASGLLATFSSLVCSDVKYPTNKIGDEIAYLRTVPDMLSGFAPACAGLLDVITETTSPDHMITLKLGWEIHCKADHLPADTIMPAITAVTDDSRTAAALAALESIHTDAINGTMKQINAALSMTISSGQTNASAPQLVPTLPDHLILALRSEVATLKPLISAAAATRQPIDDLRAAGHTSLSTSKIAFQNAINVTILANVSAGGAMREAALAVMPENVRSAIIPD